MSPLMMTGHNGFERATDPDGEAFIRKPMAGYVHLAFAIVLVAYVMKPKSGHNFLAHALVVRQCAGLYSQLCCYVEHRLP